MKKETLEEAAERLTYHDTLSWENTLAMESFKLGAKWQQERMYSVIDEYVNDVMGGCNLRFEEWFEQFKK